jgi:YHYH protein/Phosphatidylethanolamine-binding protein
MTTIPSAGTLKYNWVLSGIPVSASSLVRASTGVGTAGVGSDGPTAGYQSPCSQGPGAKTYTFTIYALSASPVLAVAASAASGAALSAAIASITLGSSVLNVNYTRGSAAATTLPIGTALTNCGYVGDSLKASTTGVATSTCDASYAYVASDGLATHAMMDGITASNLQVPVAQNFLGANAWKIPLAPAIAAATTSAVDGPIGVAINGVPIFNPCKQGGCQNGDTKVLGELDVCNGHAGRADDYHYHAAPTCLMAGKAASYWDIHPLGWALDGFAIYGYNNADGSVASRDGVCGGNTSAVSNGPSGYSYHVTHTSPYVLSCFKGTPSPDLAGQGAKFTPLRKPPVTPFPVTGMNLSLATDGYQVLQFNSAQAFNSTATGTDNYANAAGSYKIRYKALAGTTLSTALAANAGKTACWEFQFTTTAGATTQPTVSYCR